MTEHIMAEIDERLAVGDIGKGRDIGQHPSFVGTKPRTRQDTRALPSALSVGSGVGRAEETLTSFTAVAIGFGGFNQVIVSGAGSFRGFSLWHDASVVGTVMFYSGLNSQQGGLIAAYDTTGNPGSVVYSFGDFGINFNNLYVEVTGTLLATDKFKGSAWVGDIE